MGYYVERVREAWELKDRKVGENMLASEAETQEIAENRTR